VRELGLQRVLAGDTTLEKVLLETDPAAFSSTAQSHED